MLSIEPGTADTSVPFFYLTTEHVSAGEETVQSFHVSSDITEEPYAGQRKQRQDLRKQQMHSAMDTDAPDQHSGNFSFRKIPCTRLE